MQEFNPYLVADELRRATRALSSRGLKLAARWAAEMVVGLPPEDTDERSDFELESRPKTNISEDEEDNSDSYVLSKTFFDLGEYLRAAFVLDQSKPLSRKGVFLWGYSLYLVRVTQRPCLYQNVIQYLETLVPFRRAKSAGKKKY